MRLPHPLHPLILSLMGEDQLWAVLLPSDQVQYCRLPPGQFLLRSVEEYLLIAHLSYPSLIVQFKVMIIRVVTEMMEMVYCHGKRLALGMSGLHVPHPRVKHKKE